MGRFSVFLGLVFLAVGPSPASDLPPLRYLSPTPSEIAGRVSFPKQAPEHSGSCEKLVFNPWNSLVDHQPLGNLNRARKFIYRASEQFRSTH